VAKILLTRLKRMKEFTPQSVEFLENMPDGCVITDLMTVMDRSNTAAADLLHVQIEQFEGRSLADFVHEDSRQAFWNQLAHLEEDGRLVAWEIPMHLDDAYLAHLEVSVSRSAHTPAQLCWLFRDATTRWNENERSRVKLDLLRLLNENHDLDTALHRALAYLQNLTGCEAAGMRLQEGDDFPYFTTSGFSKQFVEAESNLCRKMSGGETAKDKSGNPILECMCGNVLRMRVDPSKVFFTKGGVFWTNSTTELLATTTVEDRLAPTRNRCNGEGYESVALVPLRKGDTTFGLLQFNDKRKDLFTPEIIALLEEVSGFVASVLE
jgi:GAF domain-containing protein